MAAVAKTGLLALAMSIAIAAPAAGAQSVRFKVGLTPERLGAGTTIVFSVKIVPPPGRVPPPMTGLSLLYPANFGLITSGLGLQTCTAATLESVGPEGCPANALMGYGSVVVEIPFGPLIITETGQITTWMAPVQDGRVDLLFYGEGHSPVDAQLVFPGSLIDASPPFGGRLETQIPLIPSLPEGPNVAVVQISATIGPLDVIYYARAHGKRVPYKPNGITLPDRCPSGGFPFATTIAFIDGSHTDAHAKVPCPSKPKRHH